MSEESEIRSCIPAFPFKRNEYGLLEHVDYVFNPDGHVNWRKMVKDEFLVPNKMRTAETDITKIPDDKLLILLAGFKEVAQLRGYIDVSHFPQVCTPDYVAVKTTIGWLPNYETSGKEVWFSSMATASTQNTDSFGKVYLMEIAENRGFCRAVRNFLKIHVLGKDEVQPKGEIQEISESGGTALSSMDTLLRAMDEAGLSFEKLKSGMSKKDGWEEEAKSWESIEGIDARHHFELISYIREYKKKKESKK